MRIIEYRLIVADYLIVLNLILGVYFTIIKILVLVIAIINLKKNYQMDQILKRALSIIVLICLSILFSRCQKDDDNVELSNTNIASVTSAKNWFENNNLNLEILKFTKKIDWDNAILLDKNGEKALEVPLVLENKVTTNVVEDQDYNTHMRLLFVQDKEKNYQVYDIVYTTKDATFDNNNNDFNYYKIGTKYSGYITVQNSKNNIIYSGEFEKGNFVALHNYYKPKDNNIPTTEKMVCSYYVSVGPYTTCSNWMYVPDDSTISRGPPGISGPIPMHLQTIKLDPCLTAKKLSNDVKSAAYLAAKNNILSADASVEHSITLGRDAQGNITQAPMNTGGPAKVKTTMAWQGAFAALHNHPNKTPLSGGDIYAAIILNTQLSTFTTSYILTNGETYAIVVTDLQAAQNFKTIYPADEKTGYSPEFPDVIFDQMQEAGNTIGSSNDVRTKAMASILDKYNSGITLMKQDNNGSFYPIKTTGNGTLIPCN